MKLKVAQDLAVILSNGELPSYFKEGKLVLLSKKTAKNIVSRGDSTYCGKLSPVQDL